MAVVTNTIGRRGKVMDSSFTASLEGGPELARALRKLEDAVRVAASKTALAAGGRVIADEWASRVPVGQPPEDEHPGAYRRALEDEKAVRVAKSAYGATGSVSPALLGEIANDDQPRVYAARLEWGDGDRVPQPSARPAFDAVSSKAADAVADELRQAIRRVSG